MIKKAIWAFSGYVILLTISPSAAAVVKGLAIASIVTGIEMVGPVVAGVIKQFSGQDVTNATAATLATVGILAIVYLWKPVTKRIARETL